MNYIKISLLVLSFHVTFSEQEIDFYRNDTSSGHSFHEKILCRGCGNDITFSSSIISKISPFSQHSYHDTLFSKDEVLIQVLMSDFFLRHPMITTSQSNCVGVTEWEEEDSWFPGYRWKPCVCPDCATVVGWVFEPIDPNSVDQPGTFFGHILASLIGESFLNSLAVAPKEQSIN